MIGCGIRQRSLGTSAFFRVQTDVLRSTGQCAVVDSRVRIPHCRGQFPAPRSSIERHSSDRLSAGPLYTRSTRTGLALLGSSCCTESIIVFTPIPPGPPRFGPRLKFWRTTLMLLSPSSSFFYVRVSTIRVCPNDLKPGGEHRE